MLNNFSKQRLWLNEMIEQNLPISVDSFLHFEMYQFVTHSFCVLTIISLRVYSEKP